MQLTASWGDVTLCDHSAGDIVNDWKGPAGVPQTQPASAMRRAAAGLLNRGNINHSLSFTVKRPPFSSPLDAAEFTVDHAIALQGVSENPDFEFTLGDRDFVLRKAVVTGREVATIFGTTVVYAYVVVGGLLEEVTP